MIKKTIRQNGEWWYLPRGKGTLTCCDCGLVHDIVIHLTKKGEIKTKWVRNEKETKLERKQIKNKP